MEPDASSTGTDGAEPRIELLQAQDLKRSGSLKKPKKLVRSMSKGLRNKFNKLRDSLSTRGSTVGDLPDDLPDTPTSRVSDSPLAPTSRLAPANSGVATPPLASPAGSLSTGATASSNLKPRATTPADDDDSSSSPRIAAGAPQPAAASPVSSGDSRGSPASNDVVLTGDELAKLAAREVQQLAQQQQQQEQQQEEVQAPVCGAAAAAAAPPHGAAPSAHAAAAAMSAALPGAVDAERAAPPASPLQVSPAPGNQRQLLADSPLAPAPQPAADAEAAARPHPEQRAAALELLADAAPAGGAAVQLHAATEQAGAAPAKRGSPLAGLGGALHGVLDNRKVLLPLAAAAVALVAGAASAQLRPRKQPGVAVKEQAPRSRGVRLLWG